MALNPIVFTKKIIDVFLKYQQTSYPFEDARLNAIIFRVFLKRLLNHEYAL